MNLQDLVQETFRKEYGAAPTFVVRAPGRVNLIGEHTDYNGGYVLPMTLDRAIWIALRPRRDGLVRVGVHSLDFGVRGQFDLQNIQKGKHDWIEYLKGVAWALQEEGLALSGWEGVLAGDVPIGAGLSSSAALEMAVACAFRAVSGFELDPTRMALLGQKAENKWVGVQCGIMDQLISALGREGHALLIDCLTLQTEAVPLPAKAAVVVLDTATRRGLEGSAFNERRASCEAAARHFGLRYLCQIEPAQFAARADELDEVTRRRARHVVAEQARTRRAARALAAGDAATLGLLMNESHASLRDDFEVSSQRLDVMVETARRQRGCFGARMTGAGFGGCALALVERDAVDRFVAAVGEQYAQSTGLTPAIYVCRPTRGAGLVG
jgi:galactokinase